MRCRQLCPMGRSFASATFLMVPAVWLPSGCAASVKQAAETATPAVVEGVAEEAEDKGTREAVATILGDPDIRASSSQLSSALVKGMVRGAQEEVQLAEVQRWTDALVTSLGASLARSIERDVAPRLQPRWGGLWTSRWSVPSMPERRNAWKRLSGLSHAQL